MSLNGATWDVWFGNIGWNVISYVRTSSTSSISFAPSTFLDDAASRGYAQKSWYLTSIQAGFEPWQGGVGLAVNDFTAGCSRSVARDVSRGNVRGGARAGGRCRASVPLRRSADDVAPPYAHRPAGQMGMSMKGEL